MDGNIRFELWPSEQLPDGWRQGGTAAIGEARDLADADPLHLGHPLVQAAVAEARDATANGLRVVWALDNSAPRELVDHKGKRGRLVLVKIRYDGFERVDRLVTTAVVQGEVSPLAIDSTQWLLDHAPRR